MLDTPLIIGLTVLFASLCATFAAYATSMYVNKRKLPVDIDKEKADTKLTEAGIVEKYQGSLDKQIDRNTLLTQVNDDLNNKIDALQDDVLKLKQARVDDREEFRKALEEEKQRSIAAEQRAIKAEDYIRRLLYQFKSWNIEPVPYDVEDAKEQIKQTCIEGGDIKSGGK
jgi:dynactin complex subunit